MYVVDTQVERENSISDVPFVREFLDVFPVEFPGMPPVSQVKLRIDLIHGAASITKAP